MSTAIASPFPALSDVADLFDDDPQFARHVRRAELLSHARGLPRWLKGNAVDLALVLLAGQDLGLTTWEAINSFYPDDSEESGLALYASAQRSLLHRAGWGWRIVEATHERCVVAVTDPNRPSQGELLTTYTMHDALVAELTSGPRADFWRRYPKQMLYARVTTLAVNTHAAHVVRGAPRGWGNLLAADPAPLPVATADATLQSIPNSTPTAQRPLQDPLPAPELGNEAPILHGDTTSAAALVQSPPPANPPQATDAPAPATALMAPAAEPADRPTADPAETNERDDYTPGPEHTAPAPLCSPRTHPILWQASTNRSCGEDSRSKLWHDTGDNPGGRPGYLLPVRARVGRGTRIVPYPLGSVRRPGPVLSRSPGRRGPSREHQLNFPCSWHWAGGAGGTGGTGAPYPAPGAHTCRRHHGGGLQRLPVGHYGLPGAGGPHSDALSRARPWPPGGASSQPLRPPVRPPAAAHPFPLRYLRERGADSRPARSVSSVSEGSPRARGSPLAS